jgi:phosphatidylglycerol:prolipoprotein diacylglycerol transferase
LAKVGIPLHPTQLYASLKALIVFIILIGFRRYKRGDGQIIWLYTLLYAIGRLIIEPFRGDERGLLILESITLTQAIALLLIPLSLVMVVYLGRRQATP